MDIEVTEEMVIACAFELDNYHRPANHNIKDAIRAAMAVSPMAKAYDVLNAELLKVEADRNNLLCEVEELKAKLAALNGNMASMQQTNEALGKRVTELNCVTGGRGTSRFGSNDPVQLKNEIDHLERLLYRQPALIAENEELKAKLAKREWQGIESAPDDGRSILGYDEDGAHRMHFHAEHNEWQGDFSMPDENICVFYPTHWMPLPEPPKEDEK